MKDQEDFGDGDEEFNEGDTPLVDVDWSRVEKLAERFGQVTDRASAISALTEVYGDSLEVI